MKLMLLAFVLGLVLLTGCVSEPVEETTLPAEEHEMETAPPADETPMEDTAPAEEQPMEETPEEDETPEEMPDGGLETAGYIDVSPEEAYELIETKPDLVVIDVSPHYDNGHLPGAVHYYLGDGSLDAAIPSLDKTKPYLVSCHVDSVAIQGAEKLVAAGFSTVYRLEGNYGAWVAAGYPIEK